MLFKTCASALPVVVAALPLEGGKPPVLSESHILALSSQMGNNISLPSSSVTQQWSLQSAQCRRSLRLFLPLPAMLLLMSF